MAREEEVGEKANFSCQKRSEQHKHYLLYTSEWQAHSRADLVYGLLALSSRTSLDFFYRRTYCSLKDSDSIIINRCLVASSPDGLKTSEGSRNRGQKQRRERQRRKGLSRRDCESNEKLMKKKYVSNALQQLPQQRRQGPACFTSFRKLTPHNKVCKPDTRFELNADCTAQ